MFRNSNSLPTLSTSSSLRYIVFTILYIAQGVPSGLMAIAIPAWLVKQGLATAGISTYLAIAWLPWSFKLVAGPLMDRYSFLAMGRRRPWILSAQVGLCIGFVLMSTLKNPTENIYWLAGFGFIVNLFTALQDVAVDGMAIELLPENEQARANSFMWGGKTIGKAVTAAGCSFLLNKFGFSFTMFFVTNIIGLIFLFPLLLRERPGERLLPWTSGDSSDSTANLQLYTMRSIFGNLLQAASL
ncbi:MAG: MFS transporter, partial [Spirochaetota bacterium]